MTRLAPTGLEQFLTIVRKDLRVELRTREVVYTGVLFSVSVVVMFLFTGFADSAEARSAAPGVIWATVAFAGTLVFSRTAQRESDGGAIFGLLLAPDSVGPMYAAKLVGNLLLLGVIEVALVAAVLLAFGVDAGGAPVAIIGTVVLGSVGFCALGTVLSSALATLKLREVLLPLVLYPLCLPLLLSCVKATAALVSGGGWEGARPWLAIVAIFDLLFVTLGRWLFAEALEAR